MLKSQLRHDKNSMSSGNTRSCDQASNDGGDMISEECNTTRGEKALRRSDSVRPYEGGEHSKANERQVGKREFYDGHGPAEAELQKFRKWSGLFRGRDSLEHTLQPQ